MKLLALIPARGGSKRIVNKNIRLLGGKPLITWTIEAARGVPELADVLVSTDSPAIAQVAEAAGALVPWLRPAELATDTATSMAVCLHALDWYEQEKGPVDGLLLLQPTSPFRRTADIRRAFDRALETHADAVISVCPVDHSPLWSNVLPPDGSMHDFLRAEVKGKRSQDLPAYFRINGAIYLCKTEMLRREKTFFPSRGAYALFMEKQSSIDIDDLFDFQLAEALLKVIEGTH